MGVRIIKFQPDGSLTVWHDERNHGATIATAAIGFASPSGGATGTPTNRWIPLTCPICGDITHHPASGGANAWENQLMFILLVRRLHPLWTWQQAKDAIQQAVSAMDTPDRWLHAATADPGIA